MEKKRVFMIMPFEEVFMALFDRFKEKYQEDFIFEHAADIDGPAGQKNIIKDIVQCIGRADVILADLTDSNPNVMYELGIAHSLQKKVIHITQGLSALPFDVRAYRAIEYSTRFDKIGKMDPNLSDLMTSIKKNIGDFNNPVIDFWWASKLASNVLEPIIKAPTLTEQTTEDLTKPNVDENESIGFIDGIITVEAELTNLCNYINDITLKIEEMNQDVVSGTKDIQKVKNSGESGNASYIRGIAQKIAGSIIGFVEFMKQFNNDFLESWNKIDMAYDAILNNQRINSSSTQDIKENAESLKQIQKNMATSKVQFEGMIVSIEGIKGIERRLTQAAVALISETQQYINILDIAIASIERIYQRFMMLVEESDI